MEERETRPDDASERDPTVEADRADPTTSGPGDSEGARPEPDDGEETSPPEPTGGIPDDAVDSSPDAAS